MFQMLLRGLRGLQGNIQKKTAKAAHYRHYGLGWIAQKKLKHQSKDSVHKHKFEDVEIVYKNGGDLLLILGEIFLEGIYKSDMQEAPYIIDGGANIGLSVIYFMRSYPNAVVDAYEPDPQNFQLLQKNTARWMPNVRLHQEALWKENGTITFSDTGDMSSKIALENKGISVKATRLKDLLNRKTDLLKLDIEGAEYEVILDIKDQLHNVERLFVEYHGNFDETYKLTHLLNILQEADFNYYIKAASDVYKHPFTREFIRNKNQPYDVQLNIFFFRNKK